MWAHYSISFSGKLFHGDCAVARGHVALKTVPLISARDIYGPTNWRVESRSNETRDKFCEKIEH